MWSPMFRTIVTSEKPGSLVPLYVDPMFRTIVTSEKPGSLVPLYVEADVSDYSHL